MGIWVSAYEVFCSPIYGDIALASSAVFFQIEAIKPLGKAKWLMFGTYLVLNWWDLGISNVGNWPPNYYGIFTGLRWASNSGQLGWGIHSLKRIWGFS